jgi:hypothetical protein
MRKPKLGAVISIFLTLLFSSSAAVGQIDSWEQVFNSVPDPLRVRLIERFRLMAVYERTQQWEELYDLLEKSHIEGKESFVEQRRRNAANQKERWLIEFVPKSIDKEHIEMSKANYRITGYAKVRERRCIVKREGTVYAFLQDGEWYFSGYLIALTGSHSPPPPCLREDEQ